MSPPPPPPPRLSEMFFPFCPVLQFEFEFRDAGVNEVTLLRKQNCVQDAKKCFEKFQKHFFLSRHRVCAFSMGMQTGEHLTDIEETLTLKFTDCFHVCVAKQHILKTQNLHLRSKKCFAFFSFVHPCNIVRNIDSKCFCSNIFSFTPPLKQIEHHFAPAR